MPNVGTNFLTKTLKYRSRARSITHFPQRPVMLKNKVGKMHGINARSYLRGQTDLIIKNTWQPFVLSLIIELLTTMTHISIQNVLMCCVVFMFGKGSIHLNTHTHTYIYIKFRWTLLNAMCTVRQRSQLQPVLDRASTSWNATRPLCSFKLTPFSYLPNYRWIDSCSTVCSC